MKLMKDIEVQIRIAERRLAEVERDIESERRYLEDVVKSELMNASGIVDAGVKLGKLYEKRELDCESNSKADFERLVGEYWMEMEKENEAEDIRTALNLLKEIETRNAESISRWLNGNDKRVVA